MTAGDDVDSGSSSSDGESDRPSLKDLAESVGSGRRPPTSPSRSDPGTEGGRDEPAEDAERVAPEPADQQTDAIIDLVGGRDKTVLLLGPLLEPTEYDLCSRLIAAVPGGTDNLLLVTTTESAEERVSIYQGYLDHFPARTTVIAVGDPGRAASTETISLADDQSVTIESTNDPTDMMRLGILLSKVTSAWEDEAGTSAVCVHSLTGLLRAAPDVQPVFRFTHILLARLQKLGIHTHFHMDPDEHDPDTVDTFEALFDEVITFDEAGEIDLSG